MCLVEILVKNLEVSKVHLSGHAFMYGAWNLTYFFWVPYSQQPNLKLHCGLQRMKCLQTNKFLPFISANETRRRHQESILKVWSTQSFSFWIRRC